VFAQRLLVFISIGGNEGYVSGIPDSFCDRRLVRHLFGTFIETDAFACVMDSVSVRSYILVSGTSLTRVSVSVLGSHFALSCFVTGLAVKLSLNMFWIRGVGLV
jgi:hypothetical protein